MSKPSATKRVKFEPMLGPAEDFQPGTTAWAERISNRLQLATEYVTRDTVHHVVACLEQIFGSIQKPWDVWPEGHPYRTPDDYCMAVTGHSWAWLLGTVHELTGKSFLTSEQMEVELAKAQVEHRPQGKHHEHSPLRSNDDGSGGGNSSAYLLRRLAKLDDQSFLKAYERGEYKSVRAAAIAAGVIKKSVKLKHCPYCGHDLP